MEYTINPKTGRKIKINGDTFYNLLDEGYEWDGEFFKGESSVKVKVTWMKEMLKDIRKYSLIPIIKSKYLNRKRDYDILITDNDDSIVFMIASIDDSGILTKIKKFYENNHSKEERENFITNIFSF